MIIINSGVNLSSNIGVWRFGTSTSTDTKNEMCMSLSTTLDEKIERLECDIKKIKGEVQRKTLTTFETHNLFLRER